jgi:uncharacterized membrane protein
VKRGTSKPHRSLMKAISWESFSFILTSIIVYLFTGDKRLTIELTVTCQLIKVFFFYLHERIWHRTSWGKELC